MSIMRVLYSLFPFAGFAVAYNPIFGAFSSQQCQDCVDSAYNSCLGSSFTSCLCTGLGGSRLTICASDITSCFTNPADVAQIDFGFEEYCVHYYPQEICPSAVFVKTDPACTSTAPAR